MWNRARHATAFFAALALGVSGCADGDAETKHAEQTTDTGSEEPPEKAKKKEKVQVKGLMGALPQSDIQNALQPKMMSFAGCFRERRSEVKVIGGNIKLKFRVALDGSVKWVYPTKSSVGDRKTEQCILDIASNTRFRSPSGGEAEFTWGFEYMPPEDIRPPEEWNADRISEALSDKRPKVVEECAGADAGVSGSYTVTAYVAPGGKVMAAGAASAQRSAAESPVLDCVTDKVQQWKELPDPGSYPAKVTFQVQ